MNSLEEEKKSLLAPAHTLCHRNQAINLILARNIEYYSHHYKIEREKSFLQISSSCIPHEFFVLKQKKNKRC